LPRYQEVIIGIKKLSSKMNSSGAAKQQRSGPLQDQLMARVGPLAP
jgi:hypothetical protein